MAGSTNIQLELMIKSLKIRNFRGVLMKDELRNLKPKTNECYIINLQNQNQNGSHWLGIWKKGRDVRYFDSFGTSIPEEVKKYYKGYKIKNFQSFADPLNLSSKLISMTPEKPLQKYSTDICGEISILFLWLCQKNYSFEEVMKILENSTV